MCTQIGLYTLILYWRLSTCRNYFGKEEASGVQVTSESQQFLIETIYDNVTDGSIQQDRFSTIEIPAYSISTLKCDRLSVREDDTAYYSVTCTSQLPLPTEDKKSCLTLDSTSHQSQTSLDEDSLYI